MNIPAEDFLTRREARLRLGRGTFFTVGHVACVLKGHWCNDLPHGDILSNRLPQSMRDAGRRHQSLSEISS